MQICVCSLRWNSNLLPPAFTLRRGQLNISTWECSALGSSSSSSIGIYTMIEWLHLVHHLLCGFDVLSSTYVCSLL